MTDDAASPKEPWVAGLPTWPPARDDLARVVDEDHDPAETDY